MASATLHAMLWPRMPAGERIADWVTWNLFLFWPALPDGRGSEGGGRLPHGRGSVAGGRLPHGRGSARGSEPRALASGTRYRNCPINGVAFRFT